MRLSIILVLAAQVLAGFAPVGTCGNSKLRIFSEMDFDSVLAKRNAMVLENSEYGHHPHGVEPDEAKIVLDFF